MILAIDDSIGRSGRSRADGRDKCALNYCSHLPRRRQESVGGVHHALLVWFCGISSKWQTRRAEAPAALDRAQAKFRPRIDADGAKITIGGRAGERVKVD